MLIYVSSSEMLLSRLRYATQADVAQATNIMRNFYNYLLHHTVCPEYTVDIYAARRVCDLADKELINTIFIGSQLPDDFNSAVSRLHGGTFSGFFSEGQTWDGAENLGGSEQNSKDILTAAIAAHGTHEQYEMACRSLRSDVVCEEEVNFEVTSVIMPAADTIALYEAAREKNGSLKVVGKLECRRWTYPLARQRTIQETGLASVPETFTLFLEDSLLERCFIGLKIEGLVKGLDIGIWWLDRVLAVSPSFFVLLPNEFWDKQKAAKREQASIYQDTFDEADESGRSEEIAGSHGSAYDSI